MNTQAMEHRRHEKWSVVEKFLAEQSLMPLLYGLLSHLLGTPLKRDRFHENVTLVHRSCVTFPHTAWMSQQPLHLRCLQRSKGQGPQKKRSHIRQSIYLCGEDDDGTLVNFRVPSSDNSVCSHNQTTVNEAYEKCFLHVISRGGDVPWPALSHDLSACGYFLWGCLESNLFISKPRTIEELKQRIKDEVAVIPEQWLRNGWGHPRDEIFRNKMACAESLSDSNCYVIRWNVIAFFRFENLQVFLPHPVISIADIVCMMNYRRWGRKRCREWGRLMNRSRDSFHPGRDVSAWPTRYKLGASVLRPRCSGIECWGWYWRLRR
jgi:hypothetical protein